MSRPEHLHCVNTAEGIRRINKMQEQYDEDPERYEAEERAAAEAQYEQEQRERDEYEAQMEAEEQYEYEQSQEPLLEEYC